MAVIVCADCRNALSELEPESIDCCVTSPPYWGLRDYGFSGQIGLEADFSGYIETLVEVFEQVKRVMKPSGTFWLNLGDSYVSTPQGSKPDWSTSGLHVAVSSRYADTLSRSVSQKRDTTGQGLAPKNLLGIPWRVAFALQDAGWYLRSDIIWSKPNPMPESVRDRPTKAHEYIFLLTKSARYYYDAGAIRTQAKAPTTKMPDGWATHDGGHGSFHRDGRESGRKSDKQRGHARRHDGFGDRWDRMSKAEQQATGANARTVWEIATRP